jgi:hypothetical protein
MVEAPENGKESPHSAHASVIYCICLWHRELFLRHFGKFLPIYWKSLSVIIVYRVTTIETSSIINVYVVLVMTVMMVMMTDVYDEMRMCIRYPILSTQNEAVWWRVKLDDRET